MGEQDERVFSFHGRPAACGGEVPVSVIDLKGRGTAGVPDGEVQTHVFGRIPDAEGFKARLKRRCIRRAGQYEEREQEKDSFWEDDDDELFDDDCDDDSEGWL